ncbi:MAG TPA: oligosaccharide flippase family protein [Bryobacteraceae bacterium]|nr:oligosaccharide flippase family protein [Bryobacteraceae bacterium]
MRVAFNVAANTTSTLINALCGFLILPFLISKLGRENYGIWTLIIASAGYFLLLDFGISGAVGRLVAAYRSQDDMQKINVVISTTTLMLIVVCALVALLSYFLAIPFFHLFDVPQAERADAAMALFIVGTTTALSFPGMISYGFLWGYERFDIHNFIEIPVVLIRTALTLLLITNDSSLTDLAWILSGTSVAGYTIRTAACWWVEPRLRLKLNLFSLPVLKEMFVFGVWFGLLSLTRSALPNVAPFVIGHTLNLAAVTTFTIPRLLVGYTNWVMVSGTQALAPKAAIYHFGSEQKKQQELFIIGCRYTFALSLFILGGAIFFGYELLTLWQGSPQTQEYHLLIILMCGEVIPLSQWITYNLIVSMGAHRRLAIFGVLEAITVLVLAGLLVGTHQLEGVAFAVALSALFFRGLLQLHYGCRLIRLPVWQFVRLAFLPVMAFSVPAFVLTALYKQVSAVDSWWLLFGSCILYGTLYWASMLAALWRAERHRLAISDGTTR